jgi:RNA polymerase sigma-70 factor (ECF subfamily)
MNKDFNDDGDDAALARKTLSGDKGAFEVLVERYKTLVYNISYSMLADREEAADVAQEVFIKAYCSLPGFRGGTFSSWLFRIANNLSVDRFRRRRISPVLLAADAAEGPEAQQDCPADARPHDLAADRRLWVEGAVALLPLKYRQAVMLHYFEGFSCEEVAGILRCSINTVKTRLRRARRRLREEIGREETR